MATVSLQAVYDQARRLLEGGDTERAIAVAQHILHHFPHNLEAQRILGEAHLASRQPEQAQAAFQTVLHADPENIPAYVGLGISHERQGRTEQAIAAFEQALEIKPDMPELRSQLLRLYTDTWGSESAQLRLSRAGLARLYAKGHMLPQAVQEFRSVIGEQPDRYDARVGLAEVLWRNGQDDAAITVCEDILAEHPNTLKANLLLGYLLLGMGDTRGQQYWDAAGAIDPYHTVARALFEQLPDEGADPALPAWDEQRWLTERADQERTAREREEAPFPAAEPAVAVAAVPAEPVAAASLDDELFGTSWMNTIDTGSAPPPSAEPAAAAPEDDDFLASLFSFGDDSVTAQPPTPAADASLSPFSLDDITDASPSEAPVMPPPAAAAPVDAPADEQVITPFSLSDLGLSDDEIASLDSLGDQPDAPEAPADAPAPTVAAEPPAPPFAEAPADAEEALAPFSLSDLGLSDDEIAGLDSLGDQPDAPEAPADTSADEPTMTPFSLSDLGLSDDEIADLDSLGDQPNATPQTQADEPDAELAPFSLSDLGLSDDEIAGLDSLGDQPDATPQTQAAATPPDALAGIDADLSPFSLSDVTTSADAAPSDVDDEGLSDELQPFSLDDLDISAGGGTSFDLGSLPSSLQPFSLDDFGEAPASQPQAQASLSVPDDEEPASEPAAYSWQQPTAKPSTDFLLGAAQPEQPTGQSIFAKLRQRHSELPPVEEPPLAPVADDETDMSLFSHDDISLRDDAPGSEPESAPLPAASAEPPAAPFAEAPAGAEETLTPFSLSDLGLSDDEIASLGLETPDSAAAEAPASADALADAEESFSPFSLDDLGLDDPTSFNTDQRPAELGLTEDELSGIDLGALGAAAATAETSVDTGDPALDQLITLGQRQGFVDLTDIIAAVENPEEESERIEEIGLVLHRAGIEIRDGDEIIDMDEELGANETFDAPSTSFEEQEAAAPADTFADTPAGDEADMTPFSLSDLGLSPEEIAALGLDENAPAEAPETSVAETPAPAATSIDAPASGEPDLTPFSLSDLGLSPEEIAALGLDENASTEAPETPVAEAPAPAEPETPAAEPVAPAGDEADMTPFSLSDLGLSPEEIAALDLDENASTEASETPIAETPAPAATSIDAPAGGEADMTPFSLSDLGLSPEEIAALDLDENAPTEAPETPVAEAPAPAEPESPVVEPAAPAAASADAPASDESDMTPFSLSDLGLSPEEIAAFEQEQASATAAPAAKPSEPDLSPFSLSDLGLTAEEIEALDLPNVEAASEAPPAASASEEEDEFDFSAAEAELGQSGPVRAQPGQQRAPREEEPPPPISPEDANFTPEPLDALDSIWAALPALQPAAKAEPPARAPEPSPAPAAAPRASTIERLPARGEPSRSQRGDTPARATPPARETQPAREASRPAAPAAPAERSAVSWKARRQTTFVPTGDEQLDAFLNQLDAEPGNNRLRLAIARVGGKSGRLDLALYQYKALIREGAELDDAVADIQDLIDDNEEAHDLQRLYRLLGDAYSKQNRYRDAVEAYSWTFGK